MGPSQSFVTYSSVAFSTFALPCSRHRSPSAEMCHLSPKTAVPTEHQLPTPPTPSASDQCSFVRLAPQTCVFSVSG